MLKYFLLIFFFNALVVVGQEDIPYPLHPSVGDTIELEEKLDYSLFPEHTNERFYYAYIVYKNESFILKVIRLGNDEQTGLEIETLTEDKLSQERIIEAQKNIEKINAYYRYLAADTTEKKPQSDILKNNKGIPLKLETTDKMSEHLKKQFRMDQRLKEDTRRMQEVEMGLRPREVRIEFK